LGGLFLLVVFVISLEGVLKVGFGFGPLSCPRVCVCACISVDAFALLLVGALVLVGAWWCLVVLSAVLHH